LSCKSCKSCRSCSRSVKEQGAKI